MGALGLVAGAPVPKWILALVKAKMTAVVAMREPRGPTLGPPSSATTTTTSDDSCWR
jgi:hypothetical protein